MGESEQRILLLLRPASTKSLYPKLSRKEGKKNHVQIGIETGCWCCPSHHQKIEKHSVCNCQARCLQEPSKRHLHCVWRGQNRRSLAKCSDGSCIEIYRSG